MPGLTLLEQEKEPFMNLDAQILALVKQCPGSMPLHHLCLILFPTFSWSEMQGGFACLIRQRCHELARAGRLVETAEDRFLPISRVTTTKTAEA